MMSIDELSDIELGYTTVFGLMRKLIATYDTLAENWATMARVMGNDGCSEVAATMREMSEGLSASLPSIRTGIADFPTGDKMLAFVDEHDLLFTWAERSGDGKVE